MRPVVAVFFAMSVSHAYAADRGAEELAPSDSAVAEVKLDEKASDISQQTKKTSALITSDIRQQLMEDPNLSKSAQNIKVKTNRKTVTISGVVASDGEKSKVEGIAKKLASNRVVQSNLVVK